MVTKCKWFRIEELVTPSLFELLHEDALWRLFDDRFKAGLDYIKEKFPNGSITINNWVWGGRFFESGIRTKDGDFYSSGSQHSIGSGVDLKFSHYSYNDVYHFLVNDPQIRKYFSRIEDLSGTTLKDENGVIYAQWIHLDQKPVAYPDERLYVFKP